MAPLCGHCAGDLCRGGFCSPARFDSARVANLKQAQRFKGLNLYQARRQPGSAIMSQADRLGSVPVLQVVAPTGLSWEQK